MNGEELKTLRKQAGLTQTEMADLLGLTQTYVGLMERDKAPIAARTRHAVDGLLRERIDVSYSEAIDRWIVAITKPGKIPASREHHLLAAKATRLEAVQRATVEHRRNPFAMFLIRDPTPKA